MDGVGTGHFIFAGIFVLGFISAMIYAYRKDLSKVKMHYKKVWMVIVAALFIYFAIFFMNRFT